MDDLTLLRDFRAERDDADPRARAAAWRELEVVIASTAPPVTATRTRSPRRGLMALAGAALAAIAATVLVLGSGRSAEPAAAEALHETAAIAETGEGTPALQAGPGQYVFTRTKELTLTGWYPGSYEVPGGRATRAGGFTALVPSESEWWVTPEGGDRLRTTLGPLQFLSSAERSRWEAAGSPLPSNFEPSRQEELQRAAGDSGSRMLEMRPGVLDVETPGGGGEPYPDLSGVPTDPRALRLAIQNHQVPAISDEPGEPLGGQETIEDLGWLLSRPYAPPALRAAAFDALAEVSGAEFDREATDLAGRSGYAVGYDRGHGLGLRDEFIIDPATSRLLGERTVLVDPTRDPVEWKGFEAGFTIRDVAYLQAAVVDSTRERPEGG